MIYTITGGTGTFGQAFVRRLLSMDFIDEIRVFSRDEAKQWVMKQELKDKRLKYFIGDVRDEKSMRHAFKGANVVFHAAAMKHVWSCEEFPLEALQTNVFGTANALSAAEACGVERFILLSSDKAVFPTGAMGIAKAMAEKIALSFVVMSRMDVIITRFGNLIDSRGNVIEKWKRQLADGVPLTITEPSATRFFMTTEQAMDTVVSAIMTADSGDIVLPECKSARMGDLLNAFMNKYNYFGTENIGGLGAGEKLHEWLDEETCSRNADRYMETELIGMI